MPQNEGRCALHWSLCPNMCKVEYELKFKYEEIIGNKMKMYKNFKKEITEKRDAIVIGTVLLYHVIYFVQTKKWTMTCSFRFKGQSVANIRLGNGNWP
jgi:hypothetical protein